MMRQTWDGLVVESILLYPWLYDFKLHKLFDNNETQQICFGT